MGLFVKFYIDGIRVTGTCLLHTDDVPRFISPHDVLNFDRQLLHASDLNHQVPKAHSMHSMLAEVAQEHTLPGPRTRSS